MVKLLILLDSFFAMGNFSPLIEMRGHFEWLSHYLHICCELNSFRWMANNPERSEMKCRQETVAEDDRVTSTEELCCAAFDATSSASTPITASTSNKNHPIRDCPGTRS